MSSPTSPIGSRARPTRSSATPAARCVGLDDTASGRARAAVDELEATAAATRKIAEQTRQRLAGVNTRRRDPGRVAARPRRPTDLEGAARQTNRVRLQSPDRRQRRRRHRRSQRRDGQPARRADARARHRPRQTTRRQATAGGHRRSRLRRSRRRRRSPQHRGPLRRVAPQRPTQRRTTQRRATTRVQTHGPMANRHAKAASTASNATTDSTAHASTGINGARTWAGHGVFNHNLTKIAPHRIARPSPIRTTPARTRSGPTRSALQDPPNQGQSGFFRSK